MYNKCIYVPHVEVDGPGGLSAEEVGHAGHVRVDTAAVAHVPRRHLAAVPTARREGERGEASSRCRGKGEVWVSISADTGLSTGTRLVGLRHVFVPVCDGDVVDDGALAAAAEGVQAGGEARGAGQQQVLEQRALLVLFRLDETSHGRE